MCTIKKKAEQQQKQRRRGNSTNQSGKKVCHPQNALTLWYVCVWCASAPAPEKEEAIGLVFVCCASTIGINRMSLIPYIQLKDRA